LVAGAVSMALREHAEVELRIDPEALTRQPAGI
jgi:hypothetical protein